MARAAGLLLILALAATAMADKVTLKSGETFSGTIVSEDAAKVTIKTMSGTMNIPRDAIKSVDKAGAVTPTPGTTPTTPAAPPQIVAVPVDPANAAKALSDAKSAVVAGEWIKAGGLLEGLMMLDEKSISYDDRLAVSGALITCYLQIKDAQGAAKALTRRAGLATDQSDRRRLLAAAEALRTLGSVEVGGKALSRYDEVLEAAMPWKAGLCLADAKDLAGKATRLNDLAQLDKAVKTAFTKLGEADVYVPGYSSGQKKEVVAVLVQNILTGARSAVEHCGKERPDLTRTRWVAVITRTHAKFWNEKAMPYLKNRQEGESALKNVKTVTDKYETPELCTAHQAEITKLLGQLDEFQYFPAGTSMYPPAYYYYSPPSSTERIKITLIQY
jgi:hypothetical protein